MKFNVAEGTGIQQRSEEKREFSPRHGGTIEMKQALIGACLSQQSD
ncbi:hypothetical protein [Pantoea vagans]|nr:hypothetical protein [Pantoea vagans]MDE8557467.1 hypothetical protein [Pantoea vagans]MDE8577881.1 hypothetical protein [Pantoea vagans]